MITSFGFNGFLKNNINLNLLFKSHDSGYYSFSTSSATFSNNYPVENKSGFCQIIVEENNTMVAQYIFYHDNISYFRIGDVSGITIIWSQWNKMLGEEALTTRYTLDDLSKLFFSYDRSYFNVNKYYSYMYKDKPFKMYKIFEEIYYSRDYNSIKAYHVLEEIANPFNKIMLNEYIYISLECKDNHID